MPARNAIKLYVAQGIYHVYNRGLDKQLTFQDAEDYRRFLGLLMLLGSPQSLLPGLPKNYSDEITVLAFCLMPNHFHLLIRQEHESSMPRFMRSLMNRYVHYYNLRHTRTGNLFHGRYKARLIETDEDLVSVKRYVLENPLEILGSKAALKSYPYVGTDLPRSVPRAT